MDEPAEVTWTPPSYNFSHAPLTRMSMKMDEPKNFIRKATWSPDGQSFLCQTEDHTFRIYSKDEAVKPILVSPQASPVLDYAWFPSASRWIPGTYCFAASVRECPVKLLDAGDGRLRASYPIVDHRERQVAPHSLAFSPGGDKLFCGFESAFEIFDVGRPGQEGTRVLTSPAKRSRDGIKGIISTISHSPTTSMLAIGSLSVAPWNIALYDTDLEHVPSMYIGLGEQKAAGVTQVMFNPAFPELLYASFRYREGVWAWDLRSPDAPFAHYTYATGETGRMSSQRRYFSVDITGKWLSIGDERGRVHTWDLLAQSQSASEPVLVLKPTFSFDAHGDSVPSVSHNPCEPVLLSTSGGRHYAESTSDSEDDSDDEDEDENGVMYRRRVGPSTHEASIKLWDCSLPSPPQT